MPACAEINTVMQDFTEISFSTSDQHKDMSSARLKRDEKDSKTILSYLQDRSPFSSDVSLRNICTGVVAQASAYTERAESIGKSILSCMENECAIEYTFKKKNQAVPIEANSTVKIDGEVVQVDPQLLFQRLVTAAGVGETGASWRPFYTFGGSDKKIMVVVQSRPGVLNLGYAYPQGYARGIYGVRSRYHSTVLGF